MNPSGYLHPLYAGSLAEFGVPLELARCRGWLLQRSIAGSTAVDAMGCYPLFCCGDWSQLPADLAEIGPRLVSVVLVTDPFGHYDEAWLRSCFDRVTAFKEHFVADLEQPWERFTSATHRKFARRAQRQMQIEVCGEPARHLDEWCALYGAFAAKKGITGIRAFSRASFARQLAVPGLVLFRASAGGETLGLDMWYVQGEVAHGHLVAMSDRGYELQAAYALKMALLEYFQGRVRWVNFGGTPGARDGAVDGLAAFKRGWSSGTRTAWLCGRVLNPPAYANLTQERGLTPGDDYFPAYRKGEFA
ncbi:MAG TPA: GNAT family N-acetyltransferase [Methylomirabilota bacterium]|nr:GNAT family N-acetyltransferase [Methylomirabilota bacterium]